MCLYLLGRISLPYLSTYNSSKYAAEAFSDSLRLEVKPWDVSVHIIEPTFYNTKIIDDQRKTFTRYWNAQPQLTKDEITETKFNLCRSHYFCYSEVSFDQIGPLFFRFFSIIIYLHW